MSAENMGKSEASRNSNRTQDENNSPDMATVFQGFQNALTQLVAASKVQTEAFNSFKEDLVLQPDPDEEEEEATGTLGTPDLLDLNQLLDSSENDQSSKASPSISVTRSDSEPAENLLDNLTQALLSTNKKSPDIEGKIAGLMDNILTGELSQDSVKEKGEKYPPPANCKYLNPTMVNEEIWDLLNRKSRTVDLAFQRVKEPIVQGLSSLVILADRLLKDIRSAKTVNARETLTHVIDSIALFGHANWKLNIKRRELIKPDLNPPYTRLCKEEIKPSTKLSGDDLTKHLKEMSEVKRAGQQMQKATNGSTYVAKTSSFKAHRSKPYDRPSNSRVSGFKRRPFLGHGRASAQTKGNSQPEELPQTTIEQKVREPVLPFRIHIDDLHKRVEFFKAGQVKHHLPMWESLTNDPFNLDAIKHHHIEFEAKYPIQRVRPNKAYFSPSEINIIDAEVAELLRKEVLTKVKHTANDFVSNILKKMVLTV